LCNTNTDKNKTAYKIENILTVGEIHMNGSFINFEI